MSKWWRSVKGFLARTKVSDRDFQLQLDTYRAHLLLTHKSTPAASRGASEDIVAASNALTHPERQEEVRSMVSEQMKSIFLHVARAHGIDIPPQAASSIPPPSFAVRVRESGIPGAGLGVFAEGQVEAGSIVGIHPGLVYLPRNVSRMPGFPTVLDIKHHMCVRGDMAVIDPNAAQDAEGHVTVSRDPSAQRNPYNPFAVAHFVNHPPKGVAPNVFTQDFDFPATVAPPLRPLIPNKVYKLPSKSKSWGLSERQTAAQRYAVPSSLVIASRNIEDGEELLLDYRFNPYKKKFWPSWYEPFDEEAAARRWGEVETIG